MKKLIFVVLLFVPLSFAQLSIQSYTGTKDSNGCIPPDATHPGLCIWPDGSLKVSVAGGAYTEPTNYPKQVTVSVDPVVITGSPGSAAAVTDTDPGPNVMLKFTVPQGPKGDPGTNGSNWTKVSCSAGSMVMTLANGNLANVTNVNFTGCTPTP